jgi:thermolysin metallopeptidase-like protein
MSLSIAAASVIVATALGIADAPTAARVFFSQKIESDSHQSGSLDLSQARTFSHHDQQIVHIFPRYLGLPIFLGQLTVQSDESFKTSRFSGSLPILPRNATHPLPPPTTVHKWVQAKGYSVQTIVGSGWLLNNGRLKPVVRVDTAWKPETEPLSLYLDATNGQILRTELLLMTKIPPSSTTFGVVFPENPLTTPQPTIVALQGLDPAVQYLEGDYAHVTTCTDIENCEETFPIASRDGNGNFIYPPLLEEFGFDDPFAEVNAYHNITTINSWMRKTFGWDGMFNGETWITVRVGRDWYNASFYGGNDEIPPVITFGQDVVDFAYDADVAYHEFGHAINRSIWSHGWLAKDEYGIDISSYGIEEALADIWAEQLANDPVMNSYITRSRTADNDLECPDAVMSEGHMAARFLSAFGWDVRQEIGPDAWGDVVYRTLHFLPETAGFNVLADALAQSATDLINEGKIEITPDADDIIVEKATARGLYTDECTNRIVPLEDGVPRRVYGYGSKRTGKHHYPFGLQWKLIVPADTVALKLFFNWRYPEENDDGPVSPGYTVHLRHGSPVKVKWLDESVEELEDGALAFEVVADHTIEGAPETVSFPDLSMKPLTAGQEIYILLSSATEESIVVVDALLHFSSQQSVPDKKDNTGEGDSSADEHFEASSSSSSCSAVSTTGDLHSLRLNLIAVLANFIVQAF